jgi:hypothetical protein
MEHEQHSVRAPRVPGVGSKVVVDGREGEVIGTRYAPDPGEIVVCVLHAGHEKHWYPASACEVRA